MGCGNGGRYDEQRYSELWSIRMARSFRLYITVLLTTIQTIPSASDTLRALSFREPYRLHRPPIERSDRKSGLSYNSMQYLGQEPFL